MTVPAAAALMGVPVGTPMSIPGWKEQSPFARQRGPYGLVSVPLTGQIKPEEDGGGIPLDGGEEGVGDGALCAAWIFAASVALTAASSFASSTNCFSLTLIDERVERFASRAVASCCCVEINCAVTTCCWSVRARIADVSDATRALSSRVRSRVTRISSLASWS